MTSSLAAGCAEDTDALGGTPGGSSGGGFSVTQGSVTITWSQPAQREDASALPPGEISGYRVYYGPGDGNYQDSQFIVGSASLQVTLSNIPTGTYYIAVSTVDTEGREGLLSPSFPVVVN